MEVPFCMDSQVLKKGYTGGKEIPWAKFQRIRILKNSAKFWKGILSPTKSIWMGSITPMYRVSQGIGFLKRKRDIQIARVYLGKKTNLGGQYF